MQNYKELLVWQKAHSLTLLIYKNLISFPKEEIYGISNQLKRASSSIATNIAEGTGKFTQKDFAAYLQNALGSAHEVEYLLFLSKDLNFLDLDIYNQLDVQINEIKAMLISLIKKVRSSI